MKNALIGYTGFVGSNLHRQASFSHTYNSKNIADIAGENFDTLWCAGINAVKWWANKNPQEDWQNIEGLLTHLTKVQCKKFVLISTVDVYMQPQNVNENTIPERENLHAYGLHRLQVEDFIKEHFADVTIIRLPGLFGQGLKKNIIYDFMHNNEVHKIDSRNSFQFYDLDNIYQDCQKAVEHNLPLVNIATEPLQVGTIAKEAFGLDFNNVTENPVVSYSMQTVHAHLWGKEGPYMSEASEVLAQIKSFTQKGA